ncbi:MAG: hypothetical protein WDZ37_06360 [Solirubrobacterales bacterium]
MASLLHPPVRSIGIAGLQDTFLICAVATILVIRTQLWLTNYPQLGGHGLHIAHLLWGGVLMVIAIGMLISFLGHSIRRGATVVGGIGFGFFIDELGKFITSDNNYFFKPTASVIYMIFIGLFLLTRYLQTSRGFTKHEYLVNAVDTLIEVSRHDLDIAEKRRALEMLDRADQRDPLVEPLRKLIRNTDALPVKQPPRLMRFAQRVRDRYFRLVERPRFAPALSWVFGVWAVLTIVGVWSLAFSDTHVSFLNLCSAISSAVAAGFVLLGILQLRRRRRLKAYAMFDRALEVQIFITQVFQFIESQFGAAFGLAVAVVLLITVRYMMRREEELERHAGPPGAGSRIRPAVAG